jgi:hypothetical protein
VRSDHPFDDVGFGVGPVDGRTNPHAGEGRCDGLDAAYQGERNATAEDYANADSRRFGGKRSRPLCGFGIVSDESLSASTRSRKRFPLTQLWTNEEQDR